MSILPGYQDWCRKGLMYLPPPPPSQLEPVVVPVPPEPPSLLHVPDAAPAGARTPIAIADTAAAAAIPAFARMEIKPVSFVGRRG
jgi:hypothetical protein